MGKHYSRDCLNTEDFKFFTRVAKVNTEFALTRIIRIANIQMARDAVNVTHVSTARPAPASLHWPYFYPIGGSVPTTTKNISGSDVAHTDAFLARVVYNIFNFPDGDDNCSPRLALNGTMRDDARLGTVCLHRLGAILYALLALHVLGRCLRYLLTKRKSQSLCGACVKSAGWGSGCGGLSLRLKLKYLFSEQVTCKC